MGRIIGGVIVGYLVMVVVVFISFTVAYFGMGADRAYQPASYEVSGLWVAVSFVLGLIAALAGGYVSAAIAQSRKGPRALAWVSMALGLLMAVGMVAAPKDAALGARTADVSAVEAMQKSVTPTWVAFLNPFLVAAGVLIGAGLHPKAARRDLQSNARTTSPAGSEVRCPVCGTQNRMAAQFCRQCGAAVSGS